MKKALLLPILLIGLLIPFAACSDSDNSNETNPLVGYWHIADNGRIVSLRIEENGTGEAAIYTYNGNEWNIDNLPLQYTIADGHIAIKAGNDYTLSGKMAITGASLSITGNGNVTMFTGYDGRESIIKNLQMNIENNFTQGGGNDAGGDDDGNSGNDDDGNSGSDDDATDDDNNDKDDEIIILPAVPKEDLFQTEVDFLAALAATYINIVSFEAAQLNLENIIITGKDMTGVPRSITATMPEIEECWTNAYKAINQCNTIIEYANEEYGKYADEAKALRCFLYYNIAQLWGKAPYITATDVDIATSSPVHEQDELFNIIYDEIDMLLYNFENSIAGNYRIDAGALLAIQAEIELSVGNKSVACELLSRCQPNFSLSINDSQEELFAIYGDKITLYTPKYVELLRLETQAAENIPALWDVTDAPAYGYWAMLKRTGKAQEVSGCKEHELLMPIPKNELAFNPNLTQNRGY